VCGAVLVSYGCHNDEPGQGLGVHGSLHCYRGEGLELGQSPASQRGQAAQLCHVGRGAHSIGSVLTQGSRPRMRRKPSSQGFPQPFPRRLFPAEEAADQDSLFCPAGGRLPLTRRTQGISLSIVLTGMGRRQRPPSPALPWNSCTMLPHALKD
jgi:hypothetical protein